MKKFNLPELKAVSTSMSSATSLGLDEDDKTVDQREYMRIIGSLLYLTLLWSAYPIIRIDINSGYILIDLCIGSFSNIDGSM
jgi:hypothetical protein